jgi:hypothetical protein
LQIGIDWVVAHPDRLAPFGAASCPAPKGFVKVVDCVDFIIQRGEMLGLGGDQVAARVAAGHCLLRVGDATEGGVRYVVLHGSAVLRRTVVQTDCRLHRRMNAMQTPTARQAVLLYDNAVGTPARQFRSVPGGVSQRIQSVCLPTK